MSIEYRSCVCKCLRHQVCVRMNEAPSHPTRLHASPWNYSGLHEAGFQRYLWGQRDSHVPDLFENLVFVRWEVLRREKKYHQENIESSHYPESTLWIVSSGEWAISVDWHRGDFVATHQNHQSSLRICIPWLDETEWTLWEFSNFMQWGKSITRRALNPFTLQNPLSRIVRSGE